MELHDKVIGHYLNIKHYHNLEFIIPNVRNIG
ncbi:hypothetical protein [Amedibacillus dolichus]